MQSRQPRLALPCLPGNAPPCVILHRSTNPAEVWNLATKQAHRLYEQEIIAQRSTRWLQCRRSCHLPCCHTRANSLQSPPAKQSQQMDVLQVSQHVSDDITTTPRHTYTLDELE